MSHLPDDDKDRIKERVDLVDLVAPYVALKRAGKRWQGLCPFHEEKSASFYVTPETGRYKCFGCGEGGDCFDFVMRKQGLDFVEALRKLAADVGIELERRSPEESRRAGHRSRLREVCEQATRYFQALLRSRRGRHALDYLHRRGITDESIERFRLGWSPPGGHFLPDALAKKGITEDELFAAGLRRPPEDERGAYDRFRDRVMFPISDRQGRVIAFGARALGDAKPKYLNSPETELFSKRRNLYALDLARDEMLKSREGAVMEGYTDVIMAHQCGWPVAVAGLGTALTTEQAALLARWVDRVHLIYDGDRAGRRAAEKAVPEFLPAEAETRVVLLPDGADPAELLLERGIDAFRECLDAGEEAFAFLLAARREAHDGATSAAGAALVLREVGEALAGVDDPVRRSLFTHRLADELRMDAPTVRQALDEIRSRAVARAARRRELAADRASEPGVAAAASTDEPPLDAYLGAAAPDEYASDEYPPYDAPFDSEQGRSDFAPAPAESVAPADPLAGAGPVPRAERLLLQSLLGTTQLARELRGTLLPDAVTHPVARELYVGLIHEAPADAAERDSWLDSLEHPALVELAADVRRLATHAELLRQGRECAERLGQSFDAWRHERDLLRAQEDGSDGGADDVLRDLLALHQRRAGVEGG